MNFPVARLPKKAKVVFLGKEKVGKTSLISRFIYDSFNVDYDPTVGADFAVKAIYFPDSPTVKLQIWDVAGQECFRTVQTNSYIMQSDVIALVYDLSNEDTVNSVVTWIQRVQNIRGNTADIIIVGNKSDLEKLHKRNRTAVEEEIRKSVKTESEELLPSEICEGQWEQLHFVETSAKSGENVAELFETIARLAIEREELSGLEEMQLDFPPPNPSGKWCQTCRIL